MPQPDPPEIAKACEILREIYWAEYCRGWREACAHIKRTLETETVNVAVTEITEKT